MADHKNAKKMIRKIARKTEINRFRKAKMRTAVKKAEKLLLQGPSENLHTVIVEAEKNLMRAAQKGVISKKTASRKVSRMTLRMKKLQSA